MDASSQHATEEALKDFYVSHLAKAAVLDRLLTGDFWATPDQITEEAMRGYLMDVVVHSSFHSIPIEAKEWAMQTAVSLTNSLLPSETRLRIMS